MAGSVVNLDAMIPREDMVSPPADIRGATIEKISIRNLDEDFFSAMLRKPDFQRETAHWSPEKVADLVRAFVGGDLIPAVILWRRGTNIFVIDGAHRLSALMAWVRDDYGAGKKSLQHFGGRVPAEQEKIAERTRRLLNEAVGPYAQFVGARQSLASIAEDVKIKLANLAANAIVAQWVPQVEEKAAEESFFKINQQATPIDATERLILQSRGAANSIAARAIARGGTGHQYWSKFSETIQNKILLDAKRLHAALYDPPFGAPITTLDLPIAGRGYSALPFIFELVNWANSVPQPAKTTKRQKLSIDSDGSETVDFIAKVDRAVGLVTGKQPRSLGLHPVVYYYTRGGEFQPAVFIAVLEFAQRLEEKGKLPHFTRARRALEEFLTDNKDFVTHIVKKTGAKHKSFGRIVRYLNKIVDEFASGKDRDGVLAALNSDTEFHFLIASMELPEEPQEGSNPERRFSRATKSASFISAALPGVVRCGICGGFVHRNSIQTDHIETAQSNGRTDSTNARVTHPYCNSARPLLEKTLK